MRLPDFSRFSFHFLYSKTARSHLIIICECLMLLFFSFSMLGNYLKKYSPAAAAGSPSEDTSDSQAKKDFIKWVDFDVTSEALDNALRYDVDTVQSDVHLSWTELLAYLGARYGGDFSKYKQSHMDELASRLKDGAVMAELTKDMKYYSYYLEAYKAVLDGMVGYYDAEIPSSQAPGFVLPSGVDGGTEDDPDTVWVTKYGLKAYSPIAKGFPYSDYNDFGAARSYGYKRQHLGHDMMGQVGTPVIAVESGYVEAIGWNQYGGWRLGIRSFDKKRYYYYAHLRQNYPYQSELKEGSVVQAGDVIGYLGRTGYSRTENTNNIDDPHLHFGLQLIFDESQKEGNNEIWIDCYQLIKFLKRNQSSVSKVEGTKEWRRTDNIRDTAGR